MWVMMTYDVGVKRNARMRKICRKYLIHVQKSVFEGNITQQKLKKLKWEIARIIQPDEDQVAIYELDTLRYFRKNVIGYHLSEENIL